MYLRVVCDLCSWVVPELHPRYAHGNILMWHSAAHSPMYSNTSSPYWNTRRDKGVLPGTHLAHNQLMNELGAHDEERAKRDEEASLK